VKRRIKTFLAGSLLAFALFGIAMAGPLEDGIAAAKRGDYTTALQRIRPLAERGNVAAQFSLGGMFDTGKGVSQDPVQAAFWYRKAADQGAPLAQLSLGMMYYAGEGVPQDYSMAAAFLRKAADQGNSDAQHALGVLYDNGKGVPKDSGKPPCGIGRRLSKGTWRPSTALVRCTTLARACLRTTWRPTCGSTSPPLAHQTAKSLAILTP
jgi:hypothetical protein